MGLPITAGCDTAWIRTRDCSDASCTGCLRPLHLTLHTHLTVCVNMNSNRSTGFSYTMCVSTHAHTHAHTHTSWIRTITCWSEGMNSSAFWMTLQPYIWRARDRTWPLILSARASFWSRLPNYTKRKTERERREQLTNTSGWCTVPSKKVFTPLNFSPYCCVAPWI